MFIAVKLKVIAAVTFPNTGGPTRAVVVGIFLKAVVLARVMTWENPVEGVLIIRLTAEINSIGFEAFRAFFDTVPFMKEVAVCAFGAFSFFIAFLASMAK
jgi:hypothetical protein